MRRHGMTQCGTQITLEVYKWDIVWVEMYMGWEGWEEERAHGICMTSPLLNCDQNDNFERGCEGKLILKNLNISG